MSIKFQIKMDENDDPIMLIFRNNQYSYDDTATLGHMLYEVPLEPSMELYEFLLHAKNYEYQPPNPNIPDWEVNEKFLWARSDLFNGKVAIFHEYIEELSMDGGKPALFEYDEILTAIKLWEFYITEYCKDTEVWKNKVLELTINDIE